MNPPGNDGWPGAPGSGAQPPGVEHAQQRQMNAFNQGHGQQPGPPSLGAPVLPPPSSPYYAQPQPNGHNLPGLAEMQTSPVRRPQPPPGYAQGPAMLQHSQQYPPSHGLPSLGPSLQHPAAQAAGNAEPEREARERENLERQRQGEIAAREQEERERQSREQPPQTVQIDGSIPLHHPIASGSKVHGLLSNMGSVQGSSQVYGAFGPPGGPGGIVNAPVTSAENSARAFPQPGQAPQMQPHSGAYGGPAAHPIGNANTMNQGQQPILNDALSYLDQVKIRFAKQPEVYNKFLDIMKDFKSQTIDTPGVIERVSGLFAGHSNLIQGFNTFLPPGYRIECGTPENPDAIRVTTPSGSTVQQMPRRQDIPNGDASHLPRQDSVERAQNEPPTWMQGRDPLPPPPSYGPGYPVPFSQQHPSGSNAAPNAHEYSHRSDQHSNPSAAALAHQQEQRGVSQLQNAVSVATNGHRQPAVQMTTSESGTNNIGALSSTQANIERRGPVEFNHAISYVNKIKQRFSDQPEIYKQFLEILQTYQRESKPIQEVYDQVVKLFRDDKDLLEDFKQFLPESAAHAKAVAAARAAEEASSMTGSARGGAFGSSMSQLETPRNEGRLPPVGNFAPPPSAGKDSKKRKANGISGLGSSSHLQNIPIETSSLRGTRNDMSQSGPSGRRPRISSVRASMTEPAPPPVSPTLTPALPVPLKPFDGANAHQEELLWFDRAKKAIGNRQTYNEFLKLCNLYAQDLIDKNVFISKAEMFVGSNSDIIRWFKDFLAYSEEPEIIAPQVRPEIYKVNLSHCRRFGPSYRLLPERERSKPCSGRDEVCWSVLNDEWASYPTWASEDSGFVQHRKNTFEENLHRIEEERHDYDFHIESCQHTITLLDPIVQTLGMLSDQERVTYRLPRTLGGQSEAIWQRIVKKIYGRENGQQVCDKMCEMPAVVAPILLFRCKEKLEEWRAAQREWEKVWREQIHKMYWKSLDHSGLHAKVVDKKTFQAKHLLSELVVRYEEQRRTHELTPYAFIPHHQLEYFVRDVEVLLDASHLLLLYLHLQHTGSDHQKIENLIKTFVPAFFGIDRDVFEKYMADIYEEATPDEDEMEIDEISPVEDHSSSRGKKSKGKKTDLLRGVLEKGHKGKTPAGDDRSTPSGSRNSTPDIIMTDGENSMDSPTDKSIESDHGIENHWMEHPTSKNILHRKDVPLDEPYKRESYNFYCSVNLYCFFRLFQMLYERLEGVKNSEERAKDEIRRSKALKPAIDLRVNEKLPQEVFDDTSPNARYYPQIVRKLEDLIRGDLQQADLEDILRRWYLHAGWKLYTLDKLLGGIVKFIQTYFAHDNKDKSTDILSLFFKDRAKDETTHQNELKYRQQVERSTKEGDVYRITWSQGTGQVTIQLLKKDDKTVADEDLNAEAKWSYYVASYAMREPTEGVDAKKISRPILKRNIPNLEEDEYNQEFLPQWSEEGLVIRICVSNYHLVYEPGSQDWWVHSNKVRSRVSKRMLESATEKRSNLFKEKLVMNNTWMKGLRKEDVDKANETYRKWINEGPSALREANAAATATSAATP